MTTETVSVPISGAEARRAARNAGAIAAASLLSRGLQFGWQLILVPGLGPAAYGVYGAVLAFVQVGTSIPETPLWRVEQDGSAISSTPSGNLSAPVVAVASSATTIYVTDSHAMLQLPTADNDIWREVPGLLGTRAAPVVAY